jgi:protein TonB
VFDNLIVSNPKDKKLTRGVPGSILSLVVHGVVIYAAVVATMRADDIIEEVFTDTTMVFLTEEQEPEPEPEPEQQEQQLVSLDPPPRGFQTVDAPIDIPSEIPPIDLSERFDPRDFSGVGQEGGVFSGVEGGTGPVDLTQTFMEAAVDEPPERLSGPSPRYPEMLRQAGIEGSVVLEFVIDTTGRVEESSIKINQSTNRAFEGPARDVIRRSLYRPGRVRGQAVRVLVQQSISFSIQRD